MPAVVHESHFAQIYDTEEFLIASIAEYIKIGLDKNQGLCIIATQATWKSLKSFATLEKICLENLEIQGQLIYVDSAILARIVLDPNPAKGDVLKDLIHPEIQKLLSQFEGVRCYGDVVNILFSKGEFAKAFELENTWNEYLKTQQSVKLMCGYSSAYTTTGTHDHADSICCAHIDTIPSEGVDSSVADLKLMKRLGAAEQRALSWKLAVRRSRRPA